jgi:hypothetical protein
MVNVDFEEQDWQPERPIVQSSDSKMVNLVLKTGLVKDPKKANYILVSLILICLIFTVYMIYSSSGGGGDIIENNTNNTDLEQ